MPRLWHTARRKAWLPWPLRIRACGSVTLFRNSPLGATDLGATDLGATDLGATDLGATDLGATDLGALAEFALCEKSLRPSRLGIIESVSLCQLSSRICLPKWFRRASAGPVRNMRSFPPSCWMASGWNSLTES